MPLLGTAFQRTRTWFDRGVTDYAKASTVKNPLPRVNLHLVFPSTIPWGMPIGLRP